MFVTMLFLTQASPVVNSMDDYIELDTGKPSWTAGPSNKDFVELRLNSLTWQGHQWRHEIIVADANSKSDVIILNLTGDRMGNTMDEFTSLFSKTCKLPVATVYGIPNQPLFGMREDELLGQGYMKFFTTQDNTWPLLLPMTKSTLLAMDAIQEWSKGRFSKFILTGTSKRGTTSWLAATTGDKRIIGIAPMVSDIMMDFTRQLEVEKEAWGHFSPMMPDFEKFNPLPFFKGPRGQLLMQMTDPYFSLAKVKSPVLVISATNDEFCVVDAVNLYWKSISSPKIFKDIPNASHFFAIPNALHSGFSKAQAIDSMNAVRFFADCITGKDKLGLPDLNNKVDPRRGSSKSLFVEGATPWVQESAWKTGKASEGAKFAASLEEVSFKGSGYTATFTSLVKVNKK